MARYDNVAYNATADHEVFQLRADDEPSGVEGDLPEGVDRRRLVADVVATGTDFRKGRAVDSNGIVDIDYRGGTTSRATSLPAQERQAPEKAAPEAVTPAAEPVPRPVRSPAPVASTDSRGLWELEAIGDYFSLNSGYKNWQASKLYVQRNFNRQARAGLFGEYFSTKRFGLVDHQFGGGLFLPVALPVLREGSIYISGAYTVDADVLPEYSVGGVLARDVPILGLLPSVGLQHRRYVDPPSVTTGTVNARVNVINAGVEKYLDETWS